MRIRTFAALAVVTLAGLAPPRAAAQQAPELPASAYEPKGMIAEPAAITRVTLFADRHLGKGDLTNGFYVDFGNMIPGAGWLSLGPGYRHWYAKDSAFIDASAALSSNNYRRAQARFELPKLARSRIGLGTQLRIQDFSRVRFFDDGPQSIEESGRNYHLKSKQVAGYATLRPARWLELEGETSWFDVNADGFVPAPESLTFVTTGATLTADGRDFPQHPTRGGVARVGVVRYDDRDGGAFTFKQYQADVAGFVPFGGSRVVLALHGWAVGSPDNDNVPFYFQPTLGGATTLRSFPNYRFHDRTAAAANVELRLALMTHMDLAFFADAGNVAPRFRDLNMDKRSYGTGLRLHTRRMTYAMVDVAHGNEGWQLLLRLNDPMALARLTRRAATVPFVP
jgi:hypothetical protein